MIIPEYHHVGGGLWEGGDEAGDSQQDHEGEEEVGTAAATGPGGGQAETTHTTALSVVLHKHTQCQDTGGDRAPCRLHGSLQT